MRGRRAKPREESELLKERNTLLKQHVDELTVAPIPKPNARRASNRSCCCRRHSSDESRLPIKPTWRREHNSHLSFGLTIKVPKPTTCRIGNRPSNQSGVENEVEPSNHLLSRAQLPASTKHCYVCRSQFPKSSSIGLYLFQVIEEAAQTLVPSDDKLE